MLFGIPSPDQVRQNQRQKLFGMAPQMFGSGAPGAAGTMGMALGMGLGKLFGGQNPEIARAQKIQQIQQSVQASMGDIDMSNPQNMFEMGKRLSGELLKAGETDLGLGVLEKISTIKPVTAEVSEGTQSKLRDFVVKGRGELEKKASTMNESMKRINDLGSEARKGNRSARGTMLQQVARLAQGAGVITDRDAAAVAGDMTATAALLAAVLPGVDTDVKATLRGIDPVGPGFDTDQLLKVADSLLTSGRDSVNNRMADLRDMATEARFKKQGIKAMFAGTRNIDALNKLSSAKPLNNQGSDINDLINKYAD